MKATQVTYNWFSTPSGDFFSDYTVGEKANVAMFPGYVQKDKKVEDIEIVVDSVGYRAIVKFEDGSSTTQWNLNSWSEAKDEVDE